MVHHEIPLFFIKAWRQFRNTYIIDMYRLQSPSIQLNWSNFWLSHITQHNFKMCAFLGQRRKIFLCLRQPLDWYRKNIYCKSIVLQMVLQIVSFLLFYKEIHGKTHPCRCLEQSKYHPSSSGRHWKPAWRIQFRKSSKVSLLLARNSSLDKASDEAWIGM